jgi:HAMP domain-containing protein
VVICAGTVAALLLVLAGETGQFEPDPNSVALVAGSMGLLVLALAFVIPLVLRPLSRLTDVVTTVASRRDFAIRADESHAREVQQLAAAFNQLLSRSSSATIRWRASSPKNRKRSSGWRSWPTSIR